jgi:hypothetical protein
MVRTLLVLMLLGVAMPWGLAQGQERPPTWIPTSEQRAAFPWIPGLGEVLIGQASVSMPLGRILMVRMGVEYCALTFTNTWQGEREGDIHSAYYFSCQRDGGGGLIGSNVESGTGELYDPAVRKWMGIYVQKGVKKDTIKCGGMTLHWRPFANIAFRDAELAPTPWTSLAEVNVQDARIRWYKDDRQRTPTTVHIDRLWDAPAQRLP